MSIYASVRVGDKFTVTGLVGQEIPDITVTITSITVNGQLTLHVSGVPIAPETGTMIGYDLALLLIAHSLWVPIL